MALPPGDLQGTQHAEASAMPAMRQGVKEKGENHGGSKLLLSQPRNLLCKSIKEVISGVEQGLARKVHDLEVAGSNPAPATN